MTKEQFYRNCLTKEGQEENEKEFNDLKTLKQYYKKDIDINDYRNWSEIIYIPKNGKQKTLEAFVHGIEINRKDQNGEIIGKQIIPDETYGQLLDQDKWEIYTMWDILQTIINIYENPLLKRPKKDITEYIEWAKNIYNNLKGENIYDIFVNLYNIM